MQHYHSQMLGVQPVAVAAFSAHFSSPGKWGEGAGIVIASACHLVCKGGAAQELPLRVRGAALLPVLLQRSEAGIAFGHITVKAHFKREIRPRIFIPESALDVETST